MLTETFIFRFTCLQKLLLTVTEKLFLNKKSVQTSFILTSIIQFFVGIYTISSLQSRASRTFFSRRLHDSILISGYFKVNARGKEVLNIASMFIKYCLQNLQNVYCSLIVELPRSTLVWRTSSFINEWKEYLF